MKNAIDWVEDGPAYLKAFQFEINAVNHPDMKVWGLIQGPDAWWFDRADHKAHDKILQDIVTNSLPVDENGDLPKELRTMEKRWNLLGIMPYMSSHTKQQG